MLLTPASHCFRTLAIVAAVALAVGLVAPTSASQSAATGPATAGAEGFVPIFNGRDFSGWTGAVDNYEVKDGALMCRPGQGGTLYTVAEYSDFIVRLEFNLPPGGNNGLAIRYPGKGDAAYAGMTELQVLDDTAREVRDARSAADARLGLRHGCVPARASEARRRVELPGSHRARLAASQSI